MFKLSVNTLISKTACRSYSLSRSTYTSYHQYCCCLTDPPYHRKESIVPVSCCSSASQSTVQSVTQRSSSNVPVADQLKFTVCTVVVIDDIVCHGLGCHTRGHSHPEKDIFWYSQHSSRIHSWSGFTHPPPSLLYPIGTCLFRSDSLFFPPMGCGGCRRM